MMARVPAAPYWRRAHRDWRFWIGMLLMFAGIVLYATREYLL
jgi:hypothetical protein